MSDLIVIGYDNPQTARQAYEQVQRLQQDFVVDLRGLAIVDVDADGKTHVDTPQRIVGASAVSGALFGLLLLLFGQLRYICRCVVLFPRLLEMFQTCAQSSGRRF